VKLLLTNTWEKFMFGISNSTKLAVKKEKVKQKSAPSLAEISTTSAVELTIELHKKVRARGSARARPNLTRTNLA
jgi:hypothetical protein